MSEYTLYYLYKKQRRKSGDTSSDWEDVVPSVYSYNGDGTMTPQIKEENSTECGYNQSTEPMYKWENMDISTNWICDECGGTILMPIYRWVNFDTICSGGTLYNYQKRQESYNDGEQWVDVLPPQYQIGSVIETGSTECPPYRTRWYNTNTYCDGKWLVGVQRKQYLNLENNQWEDVSPIEERTAVLNPNSSECNGGVSSGTGYHTLVYYRSVPNQKIQLTYHAEYFEDIVYGGIHHQNKHDIFSISSSVTGLMYVDVKFKNGLEDIGSCFADCKDLVGIDETLFEGLTNVKHIDTVFGGCTSLTYIPEKLFSPLINAETAASLFIACDSLTTLPNNLFKYNTKLAHFNNAFQECISLSTLPSDLFAYTTDLSVLYCTFENCSSLTEIPEGFFDNNPNITCLFHTFINCISLKTIPIKLFAKNKKIDSMGYTFAHCKNLISPCPIDEDNTPIYNRSGSGKSGYAIVSPYTHCFLDCTKMADYDSIPSDWK